MQAFTEITGVETTPEKLQLYETLLGDLPLDVLAAALERTARNCSSMKFPGPGDIRKNAVARVEEADQLEADRAWVAFKQTFARHWHPDIGVFGDPPALDPAGEYALRMIGGFRRFAHTELAHEHFVRKEFLEAYRRFRATDGLQFPSRDEAKKLLTSLQKEIAGGGE